MKLKKAISILLSILMLTSVIAGVDFEAFATSGSCGSNLTWTYSSSNYSLTISGSGDMTSYSTSSSSPWSSYKSTIYYVYINSGVTSIGSYAFNDFTKIKTVTTPSSLKTIGSRAFYGCTALNSFSTPSNLKTIGPYAFFECSSLKTIDIPSTVTSIGQCAYNKCSKVTSITVDSANEYYTSDGKALFSKDMTNLLQYASGNTNSCYEIPSSVTTIATGAFRSSENLDSVVFPNSLTTISTAAFYGCTNLASVELPSSVTTIGDSAFYQCTYLCSITIEGTTLPSISKSAFSKCTSLSSLTIPASVTGDFSFLLGENVVISEIVFTGSTMHDWSSDYTSSPQYTLKNSLTDVSINEGVTNISANAFKNCSNLEGVLIPSTCQSIGAGAFDGCSNLSYLTIDSFDCAIYASIPSSATIYCYDGSSAQKYAQNCGLASASMGKYNCDDYAAGHKYVSTVIAPTCTAQGYTQYVCSACGSNYISNYVSALGHNYSNGVCTRCGSADPNYVAPTTAAASSNSGSTNSNSSSKTTATATTLKNSNSSSKTTTTKKKSSSSILTYLASVKCSKGKIIVKWKKAKKSNGYQLQIATSKKFSKKSLKVNAKFKKSKTNAQGPASKGTYYVRIRTYRKSGKKIIYSKWSKVKSVKVK